MRVFSTLVEAVSHSFNLIRTEKLRGGRLVKFKGTVEAWFLDSVASDETPAD